MTCWLFLHFASAAHNLHMQPKGLTEGFEAGLKQTNTSWRDSFWPDFEPQYIGLNGLVGISCVYIVAAILEIIFNLHTLISISHFSYSTTFTIIFNHILSSIHLLL